MASKLAILLLSSLAVLSSSLAELTDGEPIVVVNGLALDYYQDQCPQLEEIVERSVMDALNRDIGIAAGLIRIFFHDCFVQGCDGSVLLGGPKSEQLEVPNQTLRPEALKLIDDVRATIHSVCGPIVSCADITSLATRDAVHLSGGPRYDVPLGRRDGLAPAPRDKVADLPSPFSDVSTLIDAFKNKNLDTADLVALSGAHTVGRGHCSSFSNRLPPGTDPTIDLAFAKKLQAKCANDNGTATQPLDVRTPNVFDNKYYYDLIAKQGLFTSDQGLMNDGRTKRMATRFALNLAAFSDQFARSMVKMSQMEVLTGALGEVRVNCAAPNAQVTGLETTGDDEGFVVAA